MKNKIIQFVKNHPFLYNLAKKFNRKLNRVPVKVDYVTRIIYYTYTMKSEEDLEKIRKHYSTIKKLNTKPFVIIDNNELNKFIHKYIRENTDIMFASLDYFKKYHKTLSASRMVLLDFNKDYEDEELLEYLQ